MAKYSKLGYGNSKDIDNAIASGIIDGKDLVITRDTSELIYIKDDNTKQPIKSRINTYESESLALEELNQSAETYAGQPIAIKKDDGKYALYTVQMENENFIVEPVSMSSNYTGFLWQEF